jgi:NAD(P)-dependent dehydrogenase (short-subunit alcohol dehydrogenase family)
LPPKAEINFTEFAKKSGGSVVSITNSFVVNPIAGVSVSVPMITKGGLEAITRSLVSEYAKEHIRFNTVASGQLVTPLQKEQSQRLSEDAFADGNDFRRE